MREIVFDTETTGFEPSQGHRLVEIGALELINHMPTGITFHKFINPEREIPEDATRVHGITNARVADCPLFADVAQEWLDFVGDDPMIAHNAAFDMRFINAELGWVNRPIYPAERFIDTLVMARRKFPGSPVSLDALCRRFGIDNSHREFHGALLDSELLAEVYLELRGGRQPGLALGSGRGGSDGEDRVRIDRPFRAPRPHSAAPEELEEHRAFLEKKVKNSLWLATDE
jgi:DNA polymerase-3 subunit epsilon